jgi:hypothetical protein
MTKIDVGLMGICWNYHMHGNYEDKWWKTNLSLTHEP